MMILYHSCNRKAAAWVKFIQFHQKKRKKENNWTKMWVGTRTSIQKMPNQSECFRWWFVKTLNFEPWIHLSRKFNFLGRISFIQIRLRLKIMVEASSCFNLISTKKGERVTRKQEFASLTNFLLNFKWSLKFFQTASLTCVRYFGFGYFDTKAYNVCKKFATTRKVSMFKLFKLQWVRSKFSRQRSVS